MVTLHNLLLPTTTFHTNRIDESKSRVVAGVRSTSAGSLHEQQRNHKFNWPRAGDRLISRKWPSGFAMRRSSSRNSCSFEAHFGHFSVPSALEHVVTHGYTSIVIYT